MIGGGVDIVVFTWISLYFCIWLSCYCYLCSSFYMILETKPDTFSMLGKCSVMGYMLNLAKGNQALLYPGPSPPQTPQLK